MSWVTNGSERRHVFIKASQCRSLSEVEGQMVPESGGRCREQTTKHKYANANAAHREQSGWEVICFLGWGMLMSILLVHLPKPGGKSQGLWSLSLSKWSLSSTVWRKSPVAWLRVRSRAVFARLLCWGLSSELAWTIKWNEFGQRTSALFNLIGGSLSYVAIEIYYFFSLLIQGTSGWRYSDGLVIPNHVGSLNVWSHSFHVTSSLDGGFECMLCKCSCVRWWVCV